MKTFYLAAVLLLLTACAPQKYQTRYAYTPPAAQNGAVCIQRCSTQSNQCKQRFSATTTQCKQRATQQARKEMPGRIAAYEKNLDVWEVRMARYQRDLRLYELRGRNYSIMHELARDCRHGSKKHGYKHDCKRRLPRWRGGFWLDKPVYPGKAPRRPTLQAVATAIAAKSCSQQSQCSVNYNQCYTACGGTVKPYQVLLNK